MNGFLGISVIGWVLIGLVYVPLSIFIVVLWRGRWRMKPREVAALALVAYIPLIAAVAEAVYVDARFKALCATAGTQIKQKVVVEGFYDDGFLRESWEDTLRLGHSGYRFVEWKDKKGLFWRSEFVRLGEVRRVPLDRPSARYQWRYPEFPSPDGHLMQRREETVVDTMTGQVIARQLMGYRYPPLVDRIWSQFLGGGPEICGIDASLSNTFIGIDRKDK
jgi:hypothetical protein